MLLRRRIGARSYGRGMKILARTLSYAIEQHSYYNEPASQKRTSPRKMVFSVSETGGSEYSKQELNLGPSGFLSRKVLPLSYGRLVGAKNIPYRPYIGSLKSKVRRATAV